MKSVSLKYFSEMEQLQENILDLIENNDNTEENFQKLTDNITKFNISEKEPLLVEFLHLIVNISNNHNRGLNFFANIERILKLFKDQIKNIFSNLAILYFFIPNRRLLLFLIKEQILTFDSAIYHAIKSLSLDDYDKYFYTEMKPFNTVTNDEIEEDLPLFEERRTIGENHHPICKIIWEDLIDDFIIYLNKNNISIESIIYPSIYETNEYLIGKNPRLIEYAAFYGSIQIFQYLKVNGARMYANIYEYVVHSNNAEVFHIIQENVKYDSCLHSLKESIKSHHNAVSKYIIENLFDGDFSDISLDIIKSFNYSVMNENKIYPDVIAAFAYDYSYLAEQLMQYIDVNESILRSEINTYSYDGKQFPFLIAFYEGSYEIVKLLLKQKNIDVNKIFPEPFGNYETNALFQAILANRSDIVELLLNDERTSVNIKIILNYIFK